MKAIYASKLFRASTRKDKIRAALSNPLNKELVQQLKSYLDEDEVQELAEQEAARKQVEEERVPGEVYEEDEKRDGGKLRPSTHSSGGGGYHHSPGPEGSPEDKKSLSDIVKEDELGTMDEGVTDRLDQPDAGQDDEVSESEEILGLRSTEVPPKEFKISEIQKELNSNTLTEGVRRVSNKNSELWIYYNDDINLNNVMEHVISKLETLSDKRVEFNRLARTENAIVFQVKDNEEDRK